VEIKWHSAVSGVIIILNGAFVLPQMLVDGNLWWWHFTFEITAELIFCSEAFLGPMQGGCV
jgi:hypothetical protein